MSLENSNNSKTTELKLSSYKKSSKYKDTWTITDSYILYKEEVGDLALTKSDYVECMKEIFWELSKSIIRLYKKVTLPFRLGDIEIRKRKINKQLNRRRINYSHYNSTGVISYHNNNHTSGYYFFWNWNTTKTKGLFVNKTIYEFIPNRGNDYIVGVRGLSAWITECAENPRVKDYDALIK